MVDTHVTATLPAQTEGCSRDLHQGDSVSGLAAMQMTSDDGYDDLRMMPALIDEMLTMMMMRCC